MQCWQPSNTRPAKILLMFPIRGLSRYNYIPTCVLFSTGAFDMGFEVTFINNSVKISKRREATLTAGDDDLDSCPRLASPARHFGRDLFVYPFVFCNPYSVQIIIVNISKHYFIMMWLHFISNYRLKVSFAHSRHLPVTSIDHHINKKDGSILWVILIIGCLLLTCFAFLCIKFDISVIYSMNVGRHCCAFGSILYSYYV